MLANTRRDVDKAHKEVKGSDKPKIMRAGMAALNPMQEVINKEAGINTVCLVQMVAELSIQSGCSKELL